MFDGSKRYSIGQYGISYIGRRWEKGEVAELDQFSLSRKSHSLTSLLYLLWPRTDSESWNTIGSLRSEVIASDGSSAYSNRRSLLLRTTSFENSMASLPHNSSPPARSDSISVSPELVPLPASPSPSTNSSPARFTNSTPSSSRQNPLGPIRSRTSSRSPEGSRRVRELSAPQQGSRSGSSSSSIRLDPSSTSALHEQTSPTRIDREKSPSKWFGRVSTSSSSSSSVATTNSESTSPAIKTRSSRSRSIGSLNLLTNALSPKATSSSSRSRPITPPSPTRPSNSQGIVSSPDPLPRDNRSPRSSPPIHQPPVLLETRRGSATSTNSSHSSALLHFATSLKPTRSHSQPTARRKQSGDSGGGEVLEEWADAGLEEGDEEGRAISEEMVRVTTSRSNGSSPVASIISKESTNNAGGGGGKFVQSLRRTRSKLALIGKGKEVENNNAAPISIPTAAGSSQVEEDPMMVQSPVLTFVEPPSPSESRTFYQDQEEPSQSFLDLGGRGGASSPSSSPRSSSFIVPPSQGSSTSASGRFGGWFSSMLHNSTSSAQLNHSSSPSSGTSPSPLSSPEKPRQRGGSSPTYLASPTKKSSTSSLSLPPGSSLPSSTSTSRLGPLDRMLDKAVQYFLDTDSNADKCEEEIWVLGVRHEGWRPATGAEGIEEDGRDERMPVTEGTTAGPTKSAGRRWSPVKSRAAKRQQQQQRTRETSNEGRQSRDDSPSPSLHSVSTNFSGDSLSPSIPPTSSPTTINGWPASFYLDFYSRPALTYRTNFPLIPCSPSNSGGTMHGMLNTLSLSIGRGNRNHNREESGLSSDTGWGCMLRTGQSLLANALVTAHLGRGEFSFVSLHMKDSLIFLVDYRLATTTTSITATTFFSSRSTSSSPSLYDSSTILPNLHSVTLSFPRYSRSLISVLDSQIRSRRSKIGQISRRMVWTFDSSGSDKETCERFRTSWHASCQLYRWDSVRE